jgi:FeS assembly SUF system protein
MGLHRWLLVNPRFSAKRETAEQWAPAFAGVASSGMVMPPEENHDYFAFEQQQNPPPPAGDADEVERPEGDDDPALFEPVLAALKTVQDPEIPVDLVELGLIYELLVKKGGIVFVEMTLTTPSCPVAQSMPDEVKRAVEAVPGVEDTRVKLVWTPPWTQDRMTEAARLELGLM